VTLIKKFFNRVRAKLILLVNKFRIEKSRKKLKALHNCHKGKRCFIIGNGPSLDVQDLEKLKGEICFGTHQVYKIFDKTEWRPTYYCAQDRALINLSAKEISKIQVKEKFIGIVKPLKYASIKGATFVSMRLDSFYPELPKFSEDVSVHIYEGFTVSYMCFQLAVYMGFSEIYLLGIDHNYSVTKLPNGEIQKDENAKDHFSQEYETPVVPQLYKSVLSYEAARAYAEENGITIKNATRGGKLEVFERIDFETLFNN
jgi:hypothetical protein